MKICNNCNSMQPDSANSCSNCGSSSLRNSVENISYYDNYDFEEMRKRKNKKMLSIIVVCVLIIIAILGLSAIKISKDNSKRTEINSSESTDYFVNGTIDQNIYTNKWADLKIQIPDNWQNASSKEYKSFEDKVTKCDLYVLNDGGDSIVILLTDLSLEQVGSYSENELINEMSSGIATGIKKSKTEEISYQLIGNQLYVHTNISGITDDSNICVSLYVRIVNDKAIIINIASESLEGNQKIIEKFESCD